MHITAKWLLINNRTLIITCSNAVFNIRVKLLTYFHTLTGGAINCEKKKTFPSNLYACSLVLVFIYFVVNFNIKFTIELLELSYEPAGTKI